MYIKNYSNNSLGTYTKINTVFDLQGLEFQKNYQAWWSFFFDIRSNDWSDIISKYKITNKIEIYDECLEKDVFIWYIRGYNFTENWFVRIYGNDDMWVYENIEFTGTYTGQWFVFTINSIINQFYVSTGSNPIRNNIIVEDTYWTLSASWRDITWLTWIGMFNQIITKFPQLYWVYKDGKIIITLKDKYNTVLQWSYRYDQNDLSNNTIEWFEVKNNWDSYKLPFKSDNIFDTLYIDVNVVPSEIKDIEVWYKKRVFIRWCDWIILADYQWIIQSIEYKLWEIEFYNITVSKWKSYIWPYLKNTNRFLRERLY